MSGKTITPFFSSKSSAVGVIGPLAISRIIFAFIRSLFPSLIWSSTAAGTSTSTSSSNKSAFEIIFPSLNPSNFPLEFLKSITFFMSSPF